jgi:hypothetical protein
MGLNLDREEEGSSEDDSDSSLSRDDLQFEADEPAAVQVK